MRHQGTYIDGATMQRYLREGHNERSKATWALLRALHRGAGRAARRVLGAGTLRDGATCTH